MMPSPDRGNMRRVLSGAVIAFSGILLAGCSSAGIDSGRLMVAPGKFVLFPCPALAVRAKQNADREQKLRDLMTKAEAGPGGHMASTLTYRPEYDTLMEESRQLRAMQVEKKCNTAAPATPPRAPGEAGRDARR